MSVRSSPSTSPQRAHNAARQAEHDQHILGSPPSRQRPSSIPTNVPAALMVGKFL